MWGNHDNIKMTNILKENMHTNLYNKDLSTTSISRLTQNYVKVKLLSSDK